jgi:tetratricopeptide (TPR) repeat protein
MQSEEKRVMMVRNKINRVRNEVSCVLIGFLFFGLFLSASGVWADSELHALPEVDLGEQHSGVREAIRDAEARLAGAMEADAGAQELSEYYGHLGRLYHAHGFFEAARAAYGNAKNLTPDDPQWHYLLGMVAKAQGDQELAIEYFSRVMNLNPNFVPAYLRRGRIFLSQGEWEEAEKDFAEALILDSSSIAAMAGMGRAKLAMDEYEIAAEYLESALEADPQATRLYHALGMAYRNMGQRDQARAYLEKQGEGDPAVMDLTMNRVMSLSRSPQFFFEQGLALASNGRFDQARPMLERAASLDPESARYAHRYGELLLEIEEFDAAREELERALALGADEVEIHSLLGELAEGRGDEAAAIEAYQNVFDLDPTDLASRERLGVLQMADGQAASAVSHFEWLVHQTDDTENKALFMLRAGMGKIAQNQCQQAAETLEMIESDLGVLYAPALVELARLRATCLDVDSQGLSEARGWMESIYQQSDVLEVRETLAMVYAAMGNYDEAADLQVGVLFEAARQGLHDDLPDLQRNLGRYEDGKPADRPYPPDSWRVRQMRHHR